MFLTSCILNTSIQHTDKKQFDGDSNSEPSTPPLTELLVKTTGTPIYEGGVSYFTVELSKILTKDFTFDWVLKSKTAITDSDFVSLSGTDTIPKGSTTIKIYFTTLNDGDADSNEELDIELSNFSLLNEFSIKKNPTSSSALIKDFNIVPLTNVSQVVMTDDNICALTGDKVKCWGNYYNGTGDFNLYSNPVTPLGLEANVTHITGGYYHLCAVVNGAAKC